MSKMSSYSHPERLDWDVERLEILKPILALAKQGMKRFRRYVDEQDFRELWSEEITMQLPTQAHYNCAKEWFEGIQCNIEEDDNFSYTGYFVECDIFKTDVDRVYRLVISGGRNDCDYNVFESALEELQEAIDEAKMLIEAEKEDEEQINQLAADDEKEQE